MEQNARYIVTFDADGQHLTSDLPALLEPLVAGRRGFRARARGSSATREGIPWRRKLLLRMAVLFTRVVSGVALTDAHNGLRAMTRRGAEQIHITMNRMEHASQIIDQIARSGLKYVEVPVTIRYTSETLAKGQKSSEAVRLGLKLLLEKVMQ